jgi:hypothetical protein
MNFTDTRSRTNDPDTSKAAAKNAATLRTMLLRSLLAEMITKHKGHWSDSEGYVEGWTAKELADYFGEHLPDVYRRLPECAGIKPHETLRRDGCRVWVKS